MNSTTSNAAPDTAPETPIVEPRPAVELPDTSERLREMHAGAEQGWTDHGGMVEQQSSANEWVRAADQQRAEFSPVVNQPETPREAAPADIRAPYVSPEAAAAYEQAVQEGLQATDQNRE